MSASNKEKLQEQKEQTFGIIKPDAVNRNLIGEILNKVTSSKSKIVHLRMLKLNKKQAQKFYLEHKARSFYNELVDYLSSGSVVMYVLEGGNIIEKHRKIMGKTDPKKAAKNTIRSLYGKTIMQKSVHGSDSPASAAKEINLFKKFF